MTSSAFPDGERRRLRSRFEGRRAAEALGALTQPTAGQHLGIDCSRVTHIDAFGVAVIRVGLDAHLCADPRHQATIIEPKTSDIWPFLSDGLGPLPAGAKWAGTRSSAARGTDVLIPAMPLRVPIEDTDRPLLEYGIQKVAVALRKGALPGRVLQEAAWVFLDNVEQHASGAPISPVLAAAFDPVGRNLQLVCVNLSPTGARLPQNTEELGELVDESELPFGPSHARHPTPQ